MNSIKSQPLSDRPREKLEKYGVEGLTTIELLTLILGSGSRQVPVHVLAKKIEKQFQDSKVVTVQDLLEIKGIGLAKASQILASFELVERLRPRVPEEVLDSVDKVMVHLYDMKLHEREHIVGLYLNARMKLIHKEVLGVGAMNQVIVTPKEIFGVIKSLPVIYLILAHNHPSGVVTPSTDDEGFTKRIVEAGELLGVKLLDHIIIGKSGHFSFKQAGKLLSSS